MSFDSLSCHFFLCSHTEKPDGQKKVQHASAKSRCLNFDLSTHGIPSLLPELISRRNKIELSNILTCIISLKKAQKAEPNCEKHQLLDLNRCVTALLFFVASTELSAVLFVASRKWHCLSVASLLFLETNSAERRNPIAIGIEAATRAFLLTFFAA